LAPLAYSVNFKLRVVQVLETSFLLSLMLVAIASIDRSFQGDVHVPPDAFRYALETCDETPFDAGQATPETEPTTGHKQ
jgi:hypothetical protein